MLERSTGSSASLALKAEVALEMLERCIWKLWDPSSLEAWRNATVLIREMLGGALSEKLRELGGGAGAMLVDLPADVIGNETPGTRDW